MSAVGRLRLALLLFIGAIAALAAAPAASEKRPG